MNTINLKSWVSCAAFFGALTFSTLAFAVPPIEVVLEVVAGTPPVLQVKTNSASCDEVTTNPCIEVDEGTAPFIIFKLPHACDKSASDPGYELTGMRITLIEKDWPNAGNPLNAVVAKDFKAEPTTGEIMFHAGKNKKSETKLKFKNLNSHGYTVFYEITASPCDDNSDEPDIHLDPEIRNKGRG